MIKSFEDILIQYRKRERLTLEALSSRTCYSAGYLGKVERGDIMNPAPLTARNIATSLNFSMYSTLVSFYKHGNPIKLGIDVLEEGDPIPEDEMLQALGVRKYSIVAYWKPFNGIYRILEDNSWKYNDLLDLSVDTGITEKRLEEILNSYHYKTEVELEEAVKICTVMNRRFQELFAIVCSNIHDKNTYHMACAVDTYVEKKKNKFARNYEAVADQLTDNEIMYLQEMLKVYRKLKLKPCES